VEGKEEEQQNESCEFSHSTALFVYYSILGNALQFWPKHLQAAFSNFLLIFISKNLYLRAKLTDAKICCCENK
jgi:hypothetical protein